MFNVHFSMFNLQLMGLWLLVVHGAGRMDMRNQVTRRNEDEDADEQRGDVEQEDERDVEFHGGLADIVGLGIKCNDAGIFLQEHDAYARDVSPE